MPPKQASTKQDKRVSGLGSRVSPLANSPTPKTRNPTPITPLLDSILETILLLAVGLTPLLFTPLTSELFEFPKMITVYVLAISGLFVVWLKWLRTSQIIAPCPPLKKPIILYTFTFILATATSIDLYTSLAGYYSRFDGGVAALVAYLALFYIALIHLSTDGMTEEKLETRNQKFANTSFVATNQKSEIRNSKRFGFRILNLFRISDFGFRISPPPATRNPQPATSPKILRILGAWLISASIVSIWAILEHFGHDPSCLILRHTFTANCWVQDVQARVFSTFGQPNWLAAYLVATLPVGFVIMLISKQKYARILTLIATILSYAAFWYTYSRSGWLGLVTAILILALALPLRLVFQRKWSVLALVLACALITLTSFHMAASRTATTLEAGGEDSSTGQIRLLVWQGTANLIKDYPLLGTGPGTFAFSFLPYRPRAMNDTTEWNFLYNKAHNEALNTAATTGLLGLTSWLAILAALGVYLWRQGVFINVHRPEIPNSKHQKPNKSKISNLKRFELRIPNSLPSPQKRESGRSRESKIPDSRLHKDDSSGAPLTTYNLQLTTYLSAALAAGIAGVFVSQLLGFSVVMTNLLFWLSLAIIVAPSTNLQIFNLKKSEARISKSETNQKSQTPNPSRFGFRISNLFPISGFGFLIYVVPFLLLATCYLLLSYLSAELLSTRASTLTYDTYQMLNLNQRAVALNPYEPTYHQNLAIADINAAFTVSTQDRQPFIKDAVTQAQTAQSLNPRNQIILKGLVYVYQQLANLDPKYNQDALRLAQAAWNLSPTDASAAQTVGDLQLQLNDKTAALQTYNQLITLRPYAGDSYYHRAQYFAKYGPLDKYKQDLETTLKYDPNNKEAKEKLKAIQSQQ